MQGVAAREDRARERRFFTADNLVFRQAGQHAVIEVLHLVAFRQRFADHGGGERLMAVNRLNQQLAVRGFFFPSGNGDADIAAEDQAEVLPVALPPLLLRYLTNLANLIRADHRHQPVVAGNKPNFGELVVLRNAVEGFR
ncbi:hypothetical protein D3C81_1835700 [compost metagenome]